MAGRTDKRSSVPSPSSCLLATSLAERGGGCTTPPRREAVERITVRYHGHGALAGAGVGLATGVVLGALVTAGVHGEETAGFVRSAVITVFGISAAVRDCRWNHRRAPHHRAHIASALSAASVASTQ